MLKFVLRHPYPSLMGIASSAAWRETALPEHSAIFCADDAALARAALEFAIEPLAQGDVVVFLVDPRVEAEVRTQLGARAVDLTRAERDGSIRFLDADLLAGALQLGEALDASVFETLIAGPIRELGAFGRRVHAFGTTVDVLARHGRHDLAMQLEQLWQREVDEGVSLACGYRYDAFPSITHTAAFDDVCRAHSYVGGDATHDVAAAAVQREQHVRALAARCLSLEGLVATRLGEDTLARAAASALHDLGNMLHVVQSGVSMLCEEAQNDPDRRELLDDVDAASVRASSLVQGLLAQVRRPSLRQTFASPASVANTVLGFLRRLVGTDYRLIVDMDSDLGVVTLDTARLERVLLNLALNARDAMPNGGLITLRGRAVERLGRDGTPAGWVRLEVSDTGTGMDAATRAQLFEPFFTTKGEGSGTGLGLSIVRSIVETAGGHVEVESERGRGTTFRVLLPRAPRHAQP